MKKAKEYTVNLLQQEIAELIAQRSSIPVILNDENDTQRAPMAWGVVCLAAIGVEFYFGYDFFRETLRLGILMAVMLPIAAVLTLCAGFKLFLEHYYAEAQHANVAVRKFLMGSDRMNVILRNDLEARKKLMREVYSNVRLILGGLGGAVFAAGIIMLSLERVHLKDSDEISWLTYGYNLSLTLGGAIVATCVWHLMAKRDSEVGRIIAVNEQIKLIEIDLIRLHEEDDKAASDGTPAEGPFVPEGRPSASQKNGGKNVTENPAAIVNPVVQ